MSTNSSTHPSTGPSTKETNRQRSPRSDNRASTCCTFTFADGRQCRIPRRQGHPYLCVFHAKKEARSLAGEQAGRDIASFLSGDYISACDVASALARLFSAVAQGHIKPKTAATLAYLGQTLVQTVKLAEHEYANAFGSNAWRDAIRSSFAPPPSRPAPAKCSGESLDSSPSTAPRANTTQPKTTANPITPLPSTPRAFAEIISQSAKSAATPGPPNPGTPISRLAPPTPPPSSNATPAQPSDKTTTPATPNAPQSPSTPPTPPPNPTPDRQQKGQLCTFRMNGTEVTGYLREG